MEIQCPKCRTRYEVDDGKLSQGSLRVECPACSYPLENIPKRCKPIDMKKTGSRPAASSSTPLSGATITAADSLPAKKILVVDDSPFFRQMILDILKPLRADFLVAANGTEALEIIKNQEPDVVLLDLNLPQKNGYEVIREVRSSSALKDTCLLAMSGVYHKEVDAVEAKKIGANDFIKKSFTPEILQQFVKTWLIW